MGGGGFLGCLHWLLSVLLSLVSTSAVNICGMETFVCNVHRPLALLNVRHNQIEGRLRCGGCMKTSAVLLSADVSTDWWLAADGRHPTCSVWRYLDGWCHRWICKVGNICTIVTLGITTRKVPHCTALWQTHIIVTSNGACLGAKTLIS